jgi:predicted transposase YdaD
MKVHLSDLVYRVHLKDSSQELWVFILFEHKSNKDAFVHLQLLRYMLALWDFYLKDKHILLGVVPIVFYHGIEPWETSTNFRSLLELPAALLRYVPEFEYVMVDLSQISDEEIKGDGKMKAELLLFKYIKRDELNCRYNR